MKTAQQSLLDFLVDTIPGLRDVHIRVMNPSHGNARNKKLYALWEHATKISDRQFKRPLTMSANELKELEVEGLISPMGDNFKITERGAQVLKSMILNDGSSLFDESSIKTASGNKILKIASVSAKKHGWYNKANIWK